MITVSAFVRSAGGNWETSARNKDTFVSSNSSMFDCKISRGAASMSTATTSLQTTYLQDLGSCSKDFLLVSVLFRVRAKTLSTEFKPCSQNRCSHREDTSAATKVEDDFFFDVSEGNNMVQDLSCRKILLKVFDEKVSENGKLSENTACHESWYFGRTRCTATFPT